VDDIAHILWSVAIYYHGEWWVAAVFGILPDLLVFVPFFFRKITTTRVRSLDDLNPKKDIAFFERWVLPWYGVTHSLVFVLATVGACSLLFGYRVEYWAMLIHVLMDIPSHPRSWFGTKLFWPFSQWQFNGGDWPARDFMLANYTAISAVYGVRLLGF
jgi:hypothetical protein